MMKVIENCIHLKNKLFLYQHRLDNSILEHLSELKKILADLQNLDIEILNEDTTLLFLNSVPDSYEQYNSHPNSYEHYNSHPTNGKSDIRFDDISNALMNNKYQKLDNEGSSEVRFKCFDSTW